MAFIVELWESIFTPGTTPALMKATHASFILLLFSLLALIYYTRSVHFINLFVIALLLYALVMWFVYELQQSKLKTNDELENSEQSVEVKGQATGVAEATKPQVKKRKA